MAFLQSEIDFRAPSQVDVGPALLPVALPGWTDRLFPSMSSRRANRVRTLALAFGLHAALIAGLLASRNAIDLRKVAEQSRLTLVKIAAAVQPTVGNPQKPEASQASAASASASTPPVSIEWRRVRNWRAEAGDGPIGAVGGGGGGDATSLLAGLGAAGPAGASDGVVDPYAGASPIWTGGGAKSTLLLPDAPNPAVLDEIRRYVSLQFRGVRGRAQIIVSVDGGGSVASIVSIKSDLPQEAQRALKDALTGRVVAKGAASGRQIQLPEIEFG
jgi:hypothetical protein